MHRILSFVIFIILVGCSPAPSALAIQTAIAQTELAKPTSTISFTNTPIPTNTVYPTNTYTLTSSPTKTATKVPTSTPKPTNTPEPGEFNSPAPIGMTVQRDTGNNFIEGTGVTMSVTVLDVRLGKEAADMAKKDLGYFGYEKPIEGQEYLAVQIQYDVISAIENEPFTLYRGWHEALRYEESGNLIWPVNELLYFDTPVEKYSPYTSTQWVFFLIKEGTDPKLYFQPQLFILDRAGQETESGAYFSLK